MRVILLVFALSSVVISSILAKPVFNNEDWENENELPENIMTQLYNEWNGSPNELVQPKDIQIFKNSEIKDNNIRKLLTSESFIRRKRELTVVDESNKLNTQKGIPLFNDSPNIQNEKSDLDLIQNNKLSSSANTNQPSQSGLPNFLGIPNIFNISNIPNILGLENTKPGSSAFPNLQNLLSNLPKLPQFQSKIDVPINPNPLNGIPNFFGTQNQQTGIPDIQSGIQNLPNGLPNLENGLPNVENVIQNLKNGISNFLNGLPNFSVETNSQNGLPNLNFGVDLQKAMQNLNLQGIESMYQKLKTEAENNKNNNILQQMLANFDRFMNGVRDFFGNITGGLSTRITNDINKFFSNGLPFLNRN